MDTAKFVPTLSSLLLSLAATSTASAESIDSVDWNSLVASCDGNSQCVRGKLSDFTNQNLHVVGYNHGVARRALITQVDVYTKENGQSCVNSVYSNDVACFYGDNLEKVPFNVEHSWPQSRLKEFPQSFSSTRSDLFHLYPSEVKINGARGNMPFRDCNDNTAQRTDRVSAFCDGGFQPPAVYRGLIARGMFYMSVTYGMPIEAKQEAALRKWNKQFPVTAAERERDNRINELQGNHNPFIAHAEWVELINDF
jgi:endonuclease I